MKTKQQNMNKKYAIHIHHYCCNPRSVFFYWYCCSENLESSFILKYEVYVCTYEELMVVVIDAKL